jgi:hypothetical protein
MAYQILQKESPQTVAQVVALLKTHPDFKKHWEKDLSAVPAEEHAVRLFMKAARWADDIRGQPEYDHPKWHYVNFPFKPAGQPGSVRPAPPDRESILEGFRLNRKVAQGQGKPADRAVALCWLFHLVGDVHQPLHTTSLFTTAYPEGDRGGNLLFVRTKEGGLPVNLHALWDGLILGSENRGEARKEAARLLAQCEFARARLAELKETEFGKWAQAESLPLARQVVYQAGKLRGSTNPASAPVLPEGYLQKAKAVAERRLVLAGYRLADLLKETVAKARQH